MKLYKSDTEGRKQLERWCQSHSESELARLLGVTQPAISRWVHGVCRPGKELRGPIEQVTGIRETAWQTNNERKAIQARARRLRAIGAKN